MSPQRRTSAADPRRYVKATQGGSKKGFQPKKKKDWHWSLSVTLLGWFVSFIAMLLMKSINLIYFSDVILIIVLSGLFWAIVQYIPFKKLQEKKGGDKLHVGIPLYLAYNIAGLGMITAAFVMFGNFAFSSGEKEVKIFKIVDNDPNYTASTYSGIVYLLEDNEFDYDPDLRWFEIKSNGNRKTHPYIMYQFEKGAFGFLVRGERFMVMDEQGTNPIEEDYIN